MAGDRASGAVFKAGSILGANARVMAKYGDASAEIRFKVSASSMSLPSAETIPPIQTGGSGTFKIKLTSDAAEEPQAEWSSSDTDIAEVDNSGEVTIHNDDNANNGKVATITASHVNIESSRIERIVVEGEVLPEGITVSRRPMPRSSSSETMLTLRSRLPRRRMPEPRSSR